MMGNADSASPQCSGNIRMCPGTLVGDNEDGVGEEELDPAEGEGDDACEVG